MRQSTQIVTRMILSVTKMTAIITPRNDCMRKAHCPATLPITQLKSDKLQQIPSQNSKFLDPHTPYNFNHMFQWIPMVVTRCMSRKTMPIGAQRMDTALLTWASQEYKWRWMDRPNNSTTNGFTRTCSSDIQVHHVCFPQWPRYSHQW